MITDIFIKKPVLSISLSLCILILGIISYFRLPLREYPLIKLSSVYIHTSFPGVAAESVQNLVTGPILESISGIRGIDYITGQSKRGVSIITVNMKPGYDLDKTTSEVEAKVSSVRSSLPADCKTPNVAKGSFEGEPEMQYAFTSNMFSVDELEEYLSKSVVPQLQNLDDAGQVWSAGSGGREIDIRIDSNELAARNFSGSDILQKIIQSNTLPTAGVLRGKNELIQFGSESSDQNLNRLANLVLLKGKNGYVVRLHDLAKVALAPTVQRQMFFNGKQGLALNISLKPTGNPLSLNKEVKDVMSKIDQNLPADVEMKLFRDNSIHIYDGIHEVFRTIFLAIIVVSVIVLLCVGSFRGMLIPLINIPVAMIGVLTIMSLLGFSINLISLLALLLGVGLVVDDSIVVLENIYRHIQAGEPPLQAALRGTREIFLPIIAITFTLIVVFLPVGLVPGLVGSLFSEFAFTLAGAVAISGLVALTLSPMMSSYLLREVGTEAYSWLDRFFIWLTGKYEVILRFVLSWRYLFLLLGLLLYLALFSLLKIFPKELMPSSDTGFVFGTFSKNETASNSALLPYIQPIESIISEIPEVKDYLLGLSIGSENSGMIVLFLKSWRERKRNDAAIASELGKRLSKLIGINSFAGAIGGFMGKSGASIQYLLLSPGDYQDLSNQADVFVKELEKGSVLNNIWSDNHVGQNQETLRLDREKMADLGISDSAVSQLIAIGAANISIGRYQIGSHTYNIVPKFDTLPSSSPLSFLNLSVRSNRGALIPLSAIAETGREVVPDSIKTFQQMRSVTISAMPAPGVTEEKALNFLDQTAKKTLKKGVQTDTIGSLRRFQNSSAAMSKILLFAAIFIYLALSTLFESFLDPLVVLFCVPPGFLGALFALYLIPHSSLNLLTQIGMLTLIALIAKNGILVVEFANQYRLREGSTRIEAVIKGGIIRLRPIIMTTTAVVFGSIPLLLARGPGSFGRFQLGLVIAAGTAVGTFFSLLLVPVAYSFLPKKIRKRIEVSQDQNKQ